MLRYAPPPTDLRDHTPRLLQILLPNGGYAVTLIEAYFDETGTEDGGRYLCVAGYIFESRACAQMSREWLQMLIDHKLEYFRMSQCAVDPGFGLFAFLDKAERIEVSIKAHKLVTKYALAGFVISVDRRFAGYIPTYGYFADPYTFTCWQALMAVRHWMDNTAYRGDAAYFFEAGHQSAGEAGNVMTKIFREPRLRNAYRYANHSFVDKRCVMAVQPADILAWHWQKYLKTLDLGPCAMRKDFAALLDIPHTCNHYDENRLRDFPNVEEDLRQHQIDTARRYSYGHRWY